MSTSTMLTNDNISSSNFDLESPEFLKVVSKYTSNKANYLE
jgi:hypothetical protein